MLRDGKPSQLLSAAREQRIELFTSAALLAELLDVLPRQQFNLKIQAADLSIPQLVHRYASLTAQVIPAEFHPHIPEDPDDDAVLACALAAQVDLIVSGDAHVLNLKHYHRIQIVNAAEALRKIFVQT